MEIERAPNSQVSISKENGGYIESQSVEANLLFIILEKFEEIRCGLIDVEHVIEKAD
jgi:hypothetical protein